MASMIDAIGVGHASMQLGCGFFQTLAAEFAAQDYGRRGLEQWFRPVVSRADPLGLSGSPAKGYAARAVLIDMEPKVCCHGSLKAALPRHPTLVLRSKACNGAEIAWHVQVVNAAKHAARATGRWWAYPAASSLCMESGAGNNWAHGYYGYGPAVREAAMDLVRKEVGRKSTAVAAG